MERYPRKESYSIAITETVGTSDISHLFSEALLFGRKFTLWLLCHQWHYSGHCSGKQIYPSSTVITPLCSHRPRLGPLGSEVLLLPAGMLLTLPPLARGQHESLKMRITEKWNKDPAMAWTGSVPKISLTSVPCHIPSKYPSKLELFPVLTIKQFIFTKIPKTWREKYRQNTLQNPNLKSVINDAMPLEN